MDKGEVRGFKGHFVPVKRYKEDEDNLLLIDGVNLASAAAEQDADALVSRLLRIQDANEGGTGSKKKITACVGYLTSPTGLNGEGFLVEWINKKIGAATFDLVRDGDGFTSRVEKELSRFESGQDHKA